MKSLTEILNLKLFPKQVLATEVCFDREGVKWSVAHLKRVKGAVELINTWIGDSLEEVLKETKSVPVILLVTGKKVLTKRTTVAKTEEKTLEKAFPNVNPDDVYFQIEDIDAEQVEVSVIRKETLQELWGNAEGQQYLMVDLAIGDSGLKQLYERVPDQLSVQLNEVGDLNRSQEIECIGTKLPISAVRAFLFGLIFLGGEIFLSQEELVLNSRKEWMYKAMFQKGLVVGAATFFIALLINFLLFTHYSGVNQDLEYRTQGYDGRIAEVEKLKNEYKRVQSFLEVNSGDQAQLAMMGDQIASKVPADVALIRMAFNPVERYLKRENLIRYQQGEILVQGTASRYGALAEWIKGVKQLEWVSALEIVGYEESGSKKYGEFSVKIKFKS